MSTLIEPPVEQADKNLEEVETVTIRFAGDSGDGMQLTGTQFTNTSAVVGNDISTLPDFPAEIRAPAGSLPGVSGFQLNFSSQDIKTPGDQPSVLVAMNPAALKVNLPDLEDGGTVIINTDGFTPENLKYANYASNPLEDGSLAGYRVHKLPISTLNMNALKGNVTFSRSACSTGYTTGQWKTRSNGSRASLARTRNSRRQTKSPCAPVTTLPTRPKSLPL